MDVLRATKELHPNAEFVLMTAYASVGTAVEAMRLGAFDYITKPFDPAAAKAVVMAAVRRSATHTSRPSDDAMGNLLPGMLGSSESMRALAALVRRVAPSDATVLILGETGSGKERVARATHELSARSGGPFVAVNCAAIPGELLESELFGHVKGAFTGAQRDRKGLFEAADGGTLFLDEVGDMRPSLQSKLTRVLEERAIRRVGETHERAVDVRVVAATHRDVERMVGDGAFREDLWYRLNVAAITVPALRERSDGDTLELAAHFLREANARNRRSVHGFTAEAEAALVAYDWPGNVRQLKAAVERAAILTPEDQIGAEDLPQELRPLTPAPGVPRGLEDMTWQEALEASKDAFATAYLRALMKKHDGRVTAASGQAGVERESFYRLLRRHGVELDEYRS